MPSLEEIRKFNTRLVSLGDEPAVVQGWGEELEDVDAPEDGVDEELSSLLEDDGDLDESAPPDFSALLDEEASSPLDFDDILDTPEEEPTESPSFDDSPADEAISSEAPDSSLGDIDETDDDLFGADTSALMEGLGDESDADPLDELPTDDFDADPIDGVDAPFEDSEFDTLTDADATAADDPGASFDDSEFDAPGGFDDLDLDDLDATDLDEEFAQPDDEPPAPSAPEQPSSEQDDGESFDDLLSPDDLAVDSDEDLQGSDEPEDAGEVDEFGELDESVFGDLSGLDVFEDGDQPDDSDAAPQEPSLEDDFGELPSEDADPLAAENGFDLSDEDDFGLPEGGLSLDDGVEESSADDDDEFGGFEISDEDDFSFDAPPVAPGDESVIETRSSAGDDFGEDDLDEFSLGDFGAEFGVLDAPDSSDEDLNPAINVPSVSAAAPSLGNAPGDFQLSDQEFTALRATLAGLPLNLKLAVEQIVAESKGTTEQVEKLCRMLVDGKTPSDIATAAGKITGTQIRIPRGYEKQTGVAFEAERDSFAYQFRENVWPVLRIVGAIVIVLAGVGIAAYNFVYRPLLARSLYREGLELIENDQYSLGNQTFDRAWEVWPQSSWYYDYADAFIAERQYTLAQQKYEQLLFGRTQEERDAVNAALAAGDYEVIIRIREPEKRGVLAYAALESNILGDYARAERLLQLILVQDVTDYDARLALGDNFMNWADEDPTRYELARRSYARLIERYGQTDELLFRMLRYFIRTDNLEQAIVLKDLFQQDTRAEINPEIYAELGGYLIDQGQTEDIESVLFRVLDIDNTLPEVHYHLARHYRAIRALGEEELALQTARTLLGQQELLSPLYRSMLIDTHTRIGENLYRVEAYLDAQESFTEAITLFEEGQRRRVLESTPELARAYSRLGDIFYYVGREFEDALAQYDTAERNGYDNADQDYRQGFVHYRLGEVDDALAEFREAETDPAALTNALLWSLGNTHYRRGNYFAAQAFYEELLDRVQLQRDRIRNLLVDEDPTHQSIIEYLLKTNNNLGVALYRLSEQNPQNTDFYSDSLVALTRSTELDVNYRRDDDTLARPERRDLAFLNQREALFPTPQYEMQIYNNIPEDLDDLLF